LLLLKVILSFDLISLFIREKVLTFSFHATGLAVDSEAATSSHIEEMVQELVQQERVEVPVTKMPQEKALIEVGGISTLQDSPQNSPSLNPQLGKEILMI